MTDLKAKFTAQLDAAGVDQITRWLPPAPRPKLGKHGCGTPYAPRITATRLPMLGVVFDFGPGCPVCHDHPATA